MDATFDLRLERTLPVTCEQVWHAWTDPDHLARWFCPDPFKAGDFTLVLRPGGAFNFTISGPDGERFAHHGCFLDIQPARRLVWTTTLGGGWRPLPATDWPPNFTCILNLEPTKQDGAPACHYVAEALHASAEAAQKHADMGFSEGWAKATEQLVATLQGRR
jgi:uncharacterized protein YndB with AHSA1/START domain